MRHAHVTLCSRAWPQHEYSPQLACIQPPACMHTGPSLHACSPLPSASCHASIGPGMRIALSLAVTLRAETMPNKIGTGRAL